MRKFHGNSQESFPNFPDNGFKKFFGPGNCRKSWENVDRIWRYSQEIPEKVFPLRNCRDLQRTFIFPWLKNLLRLLLSKSWGNVWEIIYLFSKKSLREVFGNFRPEINHKNLFSRNSPEILNFGNCSLLLPREWGYVLIFICWSF